MKINILILIVIVAAGFLAAGLMQNRHPAAWQDTSEERSLQPIPDFSFTDLAGGRRKMSDYAGQTVILNFWASWCAPCITEFPLMLRVAAREGTVLIALSSDRDKADIETFLNRLDGPSRALLKRGNIVIGLDPEQSITNDLFQTVSLPETIIVTPDQRLKTKMVGRIESEGDLVRVLE